MIEGFSLGNYLLLVEYTGRLFREGKAAISAQLAGIFERLGSNAENWQPRLQKLATGRLLGRFFAASRALCEKPPRGSACTTCEPGRLSGAMTRCRRLSSQFVSIPPGYRTLRKCLGSGEETKFMNFFQDPRNLHVHSLCRVSVAALFQFGESVLAVLPQ